MPGAGLQPLLVYAKCEGCGAGLAVLPTALSFFVRGRPARLGSGCHWSPKSLVRSAFFCYLPFIFRFVEAARALRRRCQPIRYRLSAMGSKMYQRLLIYGSLFVMVLLRSIHFPRPGPNRQGSLTAFCCIWNWRRHCMLSCSRLLTVQLIWPHEALDLPRNLLHETPIRGLRLAYHPAGYYCRQRSQPPLCALNLLTFYVLSLL